ncbi:hypothetical protein N8Z61_02085, partial [Candidatus Thioglobus sp.]|nr:hypothetical protein [Candidatus Thioglobus sp.]
KIEKEIKLSDLNDVLEIAKTVNIKDHNFNSSSLIERSDVNLVIEPNLQIPRWYSYGSIVLKKEIENLESKEININISQNKNFEIQTLKLESMKNFEIQTLKLESMKKLALERQNDSELIQLTQVSFEPSQPIKPNKKFIVLQGLLIGLFSSIIFLTIRKLYQLGEN